MPLLPDHGIIFSRIIAAVVVQKSVAYRTIHNILLGLGLGVFYIATYTLAVGYKTASFSYFVFTVIAVYAFVQIANSKNRGSEIFFNHWS